MTEPLDFADMMEQNEPVQRDVAAEVHVGRFHPQSAQLHHHVEILEYVTQSELEELNELHNDQIPKRKRPRARDRRGNRKRMGLDVSVVRLRIDNPHPSHVLIMRMHTHTDS